MKAVFDTNILIDYLQGSTMARRELANARQPAISIITWIEVLAGAKSSEEDSLLRNFLGKFNIIPLLPPFAEAAIAIRQQFRIRLPDALIWATARYLDGLLITRNTRDFPRTHPEIRIPYAAP